MKNSLIRSTGYWVPSNVISNDELVASYNAYAERFNREHGAAIDAGEIAEVPLSSSEFIRNASGIERRHVYEKSGILDIDSMVPEGSNYREACRKLTNCREGSTSK